VGLTGGAKTGRILANLVTGEEPSIDLNAFDPNAYN
jgi:D-amino-acid dehydrogenase